jgi:hypothetical protein
MKRNPNEKPVIHKPSNVVDQGTILEIKLQEKKIGLPALLEDTMKPCDYKRFVEYMNKNNPNGKEHK